MQTRKRNIDSVLDLVNPRRKKLQNTSPKKEDVEKESKDKQRKLAQIKESQGTFETKNIKNGPDRDPDIKKAEKEKGSNNQIENLGLQITNKPFKKRPVINEREGKDNTEIPDVKVIEIVIKVQDEANKQSEQPKGSIQYFESKETIQDDKKAIDIITIDSENASNKAVKEGSSEPVDMIAETKSENISEIEHDIIKKDEKSCRTTENNTKMETNEEADNDDDDEILDAGAIDDDQDKDYVAPKKGQNDNTEELSASNTTRMINVQAGNVKPNTKDGVTQVNKMKFRCQYCDIYFPTLENLKKHLQIRHSDNAGGSSHTCDQCGMKFNQSSSLKRHMETHMDNSERPYSCTICGKTFKRKGDVETHQIVHQDAKPFSCTTCEKKFKREISLFNHLKVHQLGKTFICDYCGMAFGYRSTLEGHLKTHSETKAFVCTICEKGFNSKQSYSDHLLRHDKIKDIVCPVCGKRYYNKKELRKHMPFHMTVTAHQCELCKMYFKDQHSLRIHRVKRHGDIYNCDFCDKTFQCRRAVKSHIFQEHRELRNARKPKMAMHEKANFKHVICDFCGKELSNKYRLKKHLISKHSGKKIVRRPPDPNRATHKIFPSGMKVLCTICNKVMFNKYKLYTHMQKIHDVPITDIKNIHLVNIEGEVKVIKKTKLKTDEMIRKVKLDSDRDCHTTYIDLEGQPIIIQPKSAKTVKLVDQVSHPGNSTIHYLDAHGNIIYTDVSSNSTVLKNYLVNDNGQMKQRYIQSLTDGERNTNHSVDDNSKGLNNENLTDNIVDYAAKAAKIIGGTKGISTVGGNIEERLFSENGEEIIIVDKPSNEIIGESSTDFNDSSDITYIVQQATDRIAAHEKAVDAKTVMNLDSDNAIDSDVRLIVSENENMVNPTEEVHYVIEDGNVNSGEIGYLVKEGLNEILNDGIVLENYDGDQEQKIIIIDENGGEQLLSSSSNDQIKITYDPETGLYTYFTEEVEVKEEESRNNQENSLNGDSSYSMTVVKEEEQQGVNNTSCAGIVNDYVVVSSLDKVNNDISSDLKEEKVNDIGFQDKQLTLERVGQLNSIDLSSQDVISSNSAVQNDYSRACLEGSVSKSNEVKVWKSDSHPINIQGPNHQTQNTEGLVAGALTLTKSGEGSLNAVIDTAPSDNDVTLFLHKSTGSQATEIQNTYVMQSEFETSFQPSSLHNYQTYEGIVDSPTLPSSSEPMHISSTFADQASMAQSQFSSEPHELYQEKHTVEVSQVSDQAQLSVNADQAQLSVNADQAQLSVSDPTSNVLEDISESVVILEQTHEPISAGFSNFNYQKDIPMEVTTTVEHTVTQSDHNLAHMEGQTNNQFYIPQVAESVNLIDADTGDKRDFIQLENMLKSGIKDASNSEEYTNFLDRMINHLQSAKDSAVGKPSSDY